MSLVCHTLFFLSGRFLFLEQFSECWKSKICCSKTFSDPVLVWSPFIHQFVSHQILCNSQMNWNVHWVSVAPWRPFFNRFWALLFLFRSQTFLGFMGRFKLNSSKLLPSLEMGGWRNHPSDNKTFDMSGQLLRERSIKGKWSNLFKVYALEKGTCLIKGQCDLKIMRQMKNAAAELLWSWANKSCPMGGSPVSLVLF